MRIPPRSEISAAGPPSVRHHIHVHACVAAAVAALVPLSLGCTASPVYLQGPRGLIGLLVLVLDIIAIVQVAQSGMSMGKKILWIFVILLLPLVGMILWYLLGRK